MSSNSPTPSDLQALAAPLLSGAGLGSLALKPAPAALSRRFVLSVAAALPLLPGLPAGNAWLATLRARADALPVSGLLQSYDVSGTDDALARTQAGCAYVYDNAVAGLALLASGDTQGARRIGDALARAQVTDRFWHDGRLRNAYLTGPSPDSGTYPLPGWWDDARSRWMEDGYQAGTATGNVAWAMLLWIALGPAWHAAAQRAADWVAANVRAPRGYAGGFLGFEPAPQRLAWVSTEHNIDLAAAFSALGRTQDAAHARAFVASMWQAGEGRFATGLKPDGSLNLHSAVDANLWPLLAPGAQPQWARALDWVLTRHGLPQGAPAAEVQGVDFNTDRDGIWLEGTAITALTLRHAGRPNTRLMATLRANTAPSGLVYASTTASLTTGLSTGLDTNAPDFLYYRRPHLAPTAWAALAQLGANPFPGT